MTDTQTSTPALPSQETLRTTAILGYALMLAAFFNGLTAIAAVVIAYIKRADARGTVYESHYANIIETFWMTLVLSILGAATVFIGVGFLILLGTFVFYLYRSIKGIIRAIDDRTYA
ncbi:MAG TPA: hypothetical protein VH000_07050 [Rhizomicrobium sp.]|jgi:uncharacterized membrane protein|nr:hypothetical protein [Rhizomicrobium sp.]